jgi:triosephosphate isomerase
MVKQKLLIVNLKNYSEVAGRYSIKLAMAAERVVPPPRVKIVVAPSAGSLAYVANAVSISVFAQHLDHSRQLCYTDGDRTCVQYT